MDIYIGNINYQLKESEIRKLFEVFGEVNQVTLIRDRKTENSKGFGFVVMPNAIQAQRAIDELDGRAVGSRNLVVKIAKSKYEDKEPQLEMEKVADNTVDKNKSGKYSKSVTEDGLIKLNFDGASN